VHPLVWTQRRVTAPGREWELPTLSRRAIAAEGFEVIERRQPSLLLDGCVLITGEVDRTTDFETGMPMHQARGADSEWEPDPLILDDQALVVHLRGRGHVVLTGCGHAGAVNICRYATRLTGVAHVAALLGGLHLSGAAFEPVIGPTVSALRVISPELLVTAHCTGWQAQHRLAAALPQAFVPNGVGTRLDLAS
jgi:7,8-dihydropterin-6-yl-methyl-4-(beta-D-ribofuranosyl)aminobenzene 5'-phosphate synthase